MEENTVDSDSTATTRQAILAVFDGMTIAEITAFRRVRGPLQRELDRATGKASAAG